MEEYKPDPNCKYCDGKGIVWTMVMGEPEKDACDCVQLVEEPIDIAQENEPDDLLATYEHEEHCGDS